MLDKNPGEAWNAELQAKFDKGQQLISGLGALVDFADADIKLMEMNIEANRKLGGGAGENWRGRDGDTIKVLSKHDSFRAAVGAERSLFDFGDYIKAMVAGTAHSDIRAALSESTDSTGGYTVPKYLLGEVIDNMRQKTLCIQAGALTVPLDGAENTIARLATDPVGGWRLENAQIAESDPSFGAVVMRPKSLAVLVKISRELLEDSLNLNDALMQAFAGSLAVSLDKAALFGSGTGAEPLGLYSQLATSVSMGVNGAALTTHYDPLLDVLFELEAASAPSPTAMIMHPRTRRTINKFSDTTGQPMRPPVALENIPMLTSTIVPINQVQGTANNASCVIMGDFSKLLIGVRTLLRIEVLRERFADNHQYAFVAHLRADVGVAQPAAFCGLNGIIE